MTASSDFTVDASVTAALAALGIDELVLCVHDASFPAHEDEDVGRGSPYSFSGREFFRFVRKLGFTAVQLGPQGKLSPGNLSPFDGTWFARSLQSVALAPLAEDERWHGLLPVGLYRRLVGGRPAGSERRVHPTYTLRAIDKALRAAYVELRAHRGARPELGPLRAELAAFRERHVEWLLPDTIFETLARRHGTHDWRRWPMAGEHAIDRRLYAPGEHEDAAASARLRALVESSGTHERFNAFAQFVVHTQHQELRRELGVIRLKLFGDLQIGASLRDWWRHQALFLGDYLMGAPPSRTNPAGQPWGYPVLDPRLFGSERAQGAVGASTRGPAWGLLRARLDKLMAEFDGVRVDHPHGLVCPWVYRADDPDPLHAVQNGARLQESPNLPDHPRLARFAIARPDQVGRRADGARYADDWVADLSSEQVDRYAVEFDLLIDALHAAGRDRHDVAAEVLSTCPAPLAAVLARHELGRFRVTQKADPAFTADPYRTSSAHPADWVMLGTHDTPPVWETAPSLAGTPRATAWARYLAERLEPDAGARAEAARRIERQPEAMVAAMFADLFVGPARRVSVFFADLLGLHETYNRPGVVDETNWTLRVPPDYARVYDEGCGTGTVLDVRHALATALRARAGRVPADEAARLTRLASEVGAPRA